MSVVVAYKTATECWMAFDSALAGDDALYIATTPKAIKHSGNGLIGAAGSWSVINALESLKSTKCTPYNVIGALKELKKEDETLDSEILFAYPGKPLTLVQIDYSVVELKQSFMAIGVGAPYALGYLEACEEIGKTELISAVEVAAKYDIHVSGPVKVLRCAQERNPE